MRAAADEEEQSMARGAEDAIPGNPAQAMGEVGGGDPRPGQGRLGARVWLGTFATAEAAAYYSDTSTSYLYIRRPWWRPPAAD